MKRTAILHEAYQQYLDGKRPLDSVLDLADHMRDFIRGAGPESPEVDAVVNGDSPILAAYRRCLDGELPVDDVLALADRYLAPG